MTEASGRRRSALREACLRGLLVLASVAFGLLLLEGAARVMRAFQRPGNEAAEKKGYQEYDPLLGWRKTPGARATYARRDYEAEVRINSRGLRDVERDERPAPGTLRILALGDSFVEAYTVSFEDMLTRALERALAEDGCRAEVVNAGTSGYSTDQEYLFYTSEGRRYSPQVVALFFYYNDVVYSDRQDYFGQPKPIFEMKDGLKLHRYPVKEKPRAAAEAVEPSAGKAAQAGSALLELLGDRVWHGAPRAYGALARLGLWRPMPRMFPRTELRVYQRREEAEIVDAWRKVEAILGALQRDTAAAGSKLVVVYVPSKMEVQERSWELTLALYRLAPDDWDRGRVLHTLREAGERQGFPVLDLTPALRAAEGRFSSTYLTYDGHWNRKGHRVAAGALAAFLEERGWLAPCRVR